MSESSTQPTHEQPPSIKYTVSDVEDVTLETREIPRPIPPEDEAVNFRGIPSAMSVETIRNLNLIECDPAIYLNPRTNTNTELPLRCRSSQR